MGLQWKEKASYGIGAIGKDMVYMLSASYILYYYQDILGVPAIYMGVILMAARIFDAFNDPIMGIVVAKTKTKFGKFRPWLFIGTVLNAFFLYLMFAVPTSITGSGLVAYAAVMYIMWGVTYTMMDIPYWSMIPAFTKSGSEREGLTTLARSCAGVGSALITIITMMAVYALGRIGIEDADTLSGAALSQLERVGFARFAFIIAVIFVITTVITCINIKETSTVDMETPTIRQMMRALFQNDQAMVVVLTIVLINCSIYITSNLVIYFFKYDFGGTDWYSAFTLFNTFGGGIQILAMMLFYPLLRKWLQSIQIFYVSFGMAIAGYAVLLALMFVDMANLFLLFVPAFFIFSANGMLTVLVTIFLANTVDYGAIKNGRRDESVIFSMQTFVVKLASGVAAMVASICLTVFQISNDTSTGAAVALNASSILGLRTTMTVIPVIGLLVAVIIFRKKFILTDEKMDEILNSAK